MDKESDSPKATTNKPITLEEVVDFLEQKKNGVERIKLKGRRLPTIQKLEKAYKFGKNRDADFILKLLG